MRSFWLCGFSAFHDWASWRKLEPCLRAAIATRDLDMAACYCDRYRMTAVTPVITSIVREMRTAAGPDISQLARIKQAWRSASRTQVARLTAPIRYLQAVALVSPLAALSGIALDAAQYYQVPPFSFTSVEACITHDLTILMVALSISVLSFFVGQNIEARASELQRIIDDLATDLVVSFLEDGGKATLPAYQAGKWMQAEESRAAAIRCSVSL